MKKVDVLRVVTENAFELVVTKGAACTDLYKRVRWWMEKRAKNGNPVRGVRLIPYGIQFDRSNWEVKDVAAIMERLALTPA